MKFINPHNNTTIYNTNLTASRKPKKKIPLNNNLSKAKPTSHIKLPSSIHKAYDCTKTIMSNRKKKIQKKPPKGGFS